MTPMGAMMNMSTSVDGDDHHPKADADGKTDQRADDLAHKRRGLTPRSHVVEFYATIERFNSAAKTISNEPSEKVSRSDYLDMIHLIEKVCQRSLPLLSKFPFDERDAVFRTEIAKWKADHADRP